MAAPQTGHQCKLYRNTGTDASPVLQLIEGVGDVSVPQLGIITAQFQVRGEDFTFVLPSIGDVITCSFTYTPGYQQAVYEALKTDFLAKTPRQYAILSGAAASSSTFGFVIPFLIKNFPWNQPLLQVTEAPIEMEGPTWMEEGGEPLTYQYFDDITDWYSGT